MELTFEIVFWRFVMGYERGSSDGGDRSSTTLLAVIDILLVYNTYTEAKERRQSTCNLALIDIWVFQSKIPGSTKQPTSVTILVAVLV